MRNIDARLATQDDSKDVLAWRNDIKTRTMSHNEGMIDWSEHEGWFRKKLQDKDAFLMICHDAESRNKVAFVRFDCDGDVALVSINLSPSMRGKGLAKPSLQAAINLLSSLSDNIVTIEAEIKQSNTKSLNLFEKTGFGLKTVLDSVAYYSLPLK